MKKSVNNQTMDAALQTFLGDLSSKEMPKPEPQPAETQEQANEAIQQETAMVNEPMPEQTDETPHQRQATPGIVGGIQGFFPLRSVHRRPQARVP